MTSTTADRPTRVSTARVGLWDRVKEIWRYRELLVAFSRTELKVKYKNSRIPPKPSSGPGLSAAALACRCRHVGKRAPRPNLMGQVS